VDPTGAGDIFAAALMSSWIIKGKRIYEAARLSNILAALSVTRKGIEGIPTEKEIEKVQ
jgi:sugar/nucleoside kinase (ribokinase family)